MGHLAEKASPAPLNANQALTLMAQDMIDALVPIPPI
jgi:hypothetical protein